MPIDYKKYHPEWKTIIVPAIKERDGHRCKFCEIENYAIGHRDDDGAFVYDLAYLKAKEKGHGSYFWGGQTGNIRIVLTCMHLDHDITNNDHDNLAMGCQRCHLRYDAEHHAKNSKATRAAKLQAKAGQIEMF